MTMKRDFMRDGGRFARAANKPDAGKNISLPVKPTVLSDKIKETREKIASYAIGRGFDKSLAGTVSRMYPKFDTEDICQAIKACAAQGNRNYVGFKTAMISRARGMKK